MESVIKKKVTFTKARILRVDKETNTASTFMVNVYGKLTDKRLLKYLNIKFPEYTHVSVEDLDYTHCTLAIDTQTFLDNSYIYTDNQGDKEKITE